MGLAAAHLDADRPDPAAPAGAGGDPGLGHPAVRRRLAEDVALAGGAPEAHPDLREGRAVLGLRLPVVLRDLHPADGVADRLHHSAHLPLLEGDPGGPAEGPPQPVPPAGPRDVRDEGRGGRRPRRRPRPAEEAGLPRRVRRGRRDLRGARLHARGREPALPPVGDRGAGRLRGRQPVRLQGRRDPRGRQRLLEQPHAVRRLRAGQPLPARRHGAVLLRRRLLRRELADVRPAQGDGAGRSSRT